MVDGSLVQALSYTFPLARSKSGRRIPFPLGILSECSIASSFWVALHDECSISHIHLDGLSFVRNVSLACSMSVFCSTVRRPFSIRIRESVQNPDVMEALRGIGAELSKHRKRTGLGDVVPVEISVYRHAHDIAVHPT